KPQQQLFAVVEVHLGPRDGRLAALQRGRRLGAQGGEYALDVLTGAKRVGAEIGAGTAVVADLEAADADAVLPAGGGVADLVVAEDAVAAEVLDDELPLDRPLPPDIDLFFAEHAGPPFPGRTGVRRMIPTGGRKRDGG